MSPRINREEEQRDLRVSLVDIVNEVSSSEANIASLTLDSVKREVLHADDGSFALADTGVRVLTVVWNEEPDPEVTFPAEYSDDEESDPLAGVEMSDEVPAAGDPLDPRCIHCKEPVRMVMDYYVHTGINAVISYSPYVHPAEWRRG